MGEVYEIGREAKQAVEFDSRTRLLAEVSNPLPVDSQGVQFASMSDQDLERKIRDLHADPSKVEVVKGAYEEIIKRHDARFTDADHADVLPKMALLMECIKQGKGLRQAHGGGYEIDPDKPLSESDRFSYHSAIIKTIELMNTPIQVRHDYVGYLRMVGHYADAVRVAESESVKANLLMKEIPFGDRKVRMMDLIKAEQSRLLEDQVFISDPRKRQAMDLTAHLLIGQNLFDENPRRRSNTTDAGVINAPVNADKQLASLYLGTEVVFKSDRSGRVETVKFGMNTGFKPDKAMEAVMRARETIMYMSGNDPSTAEFARMNPGAVSLFGMDYEFIPDGETMNVFLDEDRDGKPDLLAISSIENLNNTIREGSKSASMLTDVAVAAIGLGVLALTRGNTRVSAAAESALSKVGPAARLAAEHPQALRAMANTGRYAIAFGAAVPVRHYGYSYMTGGNETWQDSMVHAAGALVTAELGSRAVGRATTLADNGGVISKPFNMVKMDATGSAQVFAREGYTTTGRVAEMLKRSGYSAEAKAFEAIPPGTSITSQAAVDAIRKAELTFGRMSTVSKALLGDQSAVARVIRKTGGDQGKLAERGLTADMIPESFAELTARTSLISRLKNQVTDRLRFAPLDPTTATATEVARARTATNLAGGLVASGTYNSTVAAYDLQNSVNGATGQKYTYGEALLEANFPTYKGEDNSSMPEWLLMKTVTGLPGQAIFAAPLMGSGAIYQPLLNKSGALWNSTAHGVPYKLLKTMQWAPGQVWHTLSPFSATARNNASAFFFNNTAIGPAKTLLGSSTLPMLESLGDRFSSENGQLIDRNAELRRALQYASEPVQNGR